MTHSSNALKINETSESIQLYIPKLLTTRITKEQEAVVVTTPAAATASALTANSNDLNFIQRTLKNSSNVIENDGQHDNDIDNGHDIHNDVNANEYYMELNNHNHPESDDNDDALAFNVTSSILDFRKRKTKIDGATAIAEKAIPSTIALTTTTTTTTTTIKHDHNNKKICAINSASNSNSKSNTSSKSSDISNSFATPNFTANDRDDNDNDNDNDNNNYNVNDNNDKCDNDIYSCDSLESFSLDTYSSASTTTEVADTTNTTNTTNTTLILESCCSTKLSLQRDELVEDSNTGKDVGKRIDSKLDNNTMMAAWSSSSSPSPSSSSSPSPSSSSSSSSNVAHITTVSASSNYPNITNKSPMYIIKIQTIQLKQTLPSVHNKRTVQSKYQKNSIVNPSTSHKALMLTQMPSPTLTLMSTLPSTSLSSSAFVNHATTSTTTVAASSAVITLIGIVNDDADGGDGNELDGNKHDDDSQNVNITGNTNNQLRHSCTMSYLTNALNDKPSSSYGMANVHKRTLSSSSYRSGTSHYSVHTINSTTLSAKASCKFWTCLRWLCVWLKNSGIGEPSVHHALIVIFLEFFAWGLLTMPVIAVLNQTFPDHTFLMNGLVMGIKGILSFLSAPLIGALSDIWGRKFFLLITVFFTCAPIPLMTINTWWFFAMISISGIFAVTFSVVFAYVADVTTVEGRSRAYGLVSATFAASLVISPALGAALMEKYSDTLVVALATAIAVLDVFFILVAVPESLPDKVRPSSWGAPINWEQADPFAALRKVGSDHTILMQCVTVLLSYLPEAGQYSCIFVYLKLKMSFNTMEVAIFIAVVGILSISVQVTLGYLMRKVGAKQTIILGLILEMTQLFWYGFGSQKWMMWAAGILAALGSITYPAISAFVSIHSTADSQGAVQGMVTGMRGLCNGLGPAMFGIIFYLFNVDLNDEHALLENATIHAVSGNASSSGGNGSGGIGKWLQMPGPPFVFGGFMVILAILVALFIPEYHNEFNFKGSPIEKKRISLDVQYEIECGPTSTSPLMHSDSLAQL